MLRPNAVGILDGANAGNGHDAPPKIGFHPAGRLGSRRVKQHIGIRFLARTGHDYRQFPDAGTGARTLWMNEDEQSRTSGYRLSRPANWQIRRRYREVAWSIRVT